MLVPLACSSVALAVLAAPAAPEQLVDLVRPIVGTARKDQRIGAINSGQTFPAVGVPFGMTHWTPQTQASEDKCVAPFYAQDERIQGIRASHWWSGSCTHDYGSATIAAIVGPLRPGAEERASTYRARNEPRDLYDLWYLTSEGHVDLAMLVGEIDSKLEFRGRSRDAMAEELARKEARYEKLWRVRLGAQMTALPPFDEVFRSVRKALRRARLIPKG